MAAAGRGLSHQVERVAMGAAVEVAPFAAPRGAQMHHQGLPSAAGEIAAAPVFAVAPSAGQQPLDQALEPAAGQLPRHIAGIEPIAGGGAHIRLAGISALAGDIPARRAVASAWAKRNAPISTSTCAGRNSTKLRQQPHGWVRITCTSPSSSTAVPISLAWMSPLIAISRARATPPRI